MRPHPLAAYNEWQRNIDPSMDARQAVGKVAPDTYVDVEPNGAWSQDLSAIPFVSVEALRELRDLLVTGLTVEVSAPMTAFAVSEHQSIRQAASPLAHTPLKRAQLTIFEFQLGMFLSDSVEEHFGTGVGFIL